ncbi:hypothetical protein ACFX16_030998 [Malus domestica]
MLPGLCKFICILRWDGTERSGTRRSVPCLVRLKRVERAVLRDKFWVNFHSASPSWNDSFHIRGTQNYNLFVSFFFLLVSIRRHLCSLFVPSRAVLSRSISSRPICIPNDT